MDRYLLIAGHLLCVDWHLRPALPELRKSVLIDRRLHDWLAKCWAEEWLLTEGALPEQARRKLKWCGDNCRLLGACCMCTSW